MLVLLIYGFIKYAVDMDSCGMIHITKFYEDFKQYQGFRSEI
jgi:hypothetical protein